MNNYQDDLIDSTDFTLTSASIPDPESAYQREIDRRASDCRVNQTSIEWTQDAISLHEACAPWNRASAHGMQALSDFELLKNIGGGAAAELLESAGSLTKLARWSMSQIEMIDGIGRQKAAAIKSAFELIRRVTQANEIESGLPFSEAERVYHYLTHECIALDVEKMFVLCLDRKNRLLHRSTVTSGTATSTLCHPREIFRPAIMHSAAAIIVAHNHPSGDPAPSRADIQITRQLREASKTIGIDMLDHIIIGNPAHDPQFRGYYSFNEAGLI